MGLECNAVVYAALRAVDKDLEFMKNNLEAMDKAFTL
jgi:DNA-binding FadR family transcriptional regulator